MEIMRRVEQFLLSLRALHIKGDLNQQADWVSRCRVNNSDWCLNQEVFNLIGQMFSPSSTELFMDHTNTKRPKYFTMEADPRSMGADALSHS